jgi:adenylosuccinate synthase
MVVNYAIIGANFGDEGKGLIVDHLAALDPKSLVVRYCGGSQAGHTVTTPDGRRHVFHHFGSGTLAGADTYLSRFMIVNPITFVRERKELASKIDGRLPSMFLDGQASVTTPYDMLINRGLERHRKAEKHGSCGLGINETVVRSAHEDYRLTVADIGSPLTVKDQLRRIRNEWLPERLRQLGMGTLPNKEAFWAASDHVFANFLIDCESMLTDPIVRRADTFYVEKRPVIFEGAQGLWLDEDSGYFPHVTRARTGLHNVRLLMREMGIKEVEPIYVTRAYFTRHGVGPLPGELKGPPYQDIVDPTNHWNEHQDSPRFALFDVDHFVQGIERDRDFLPTADIRVAVTCLDQVGGTVRYMRKGVEGKAEPDAFAGMVSRAVRAGPGFLVSGPTRNDVHDMAAAMRRGAE